MATVNKTNLVDRVAERLEVNRKQAQAAVEAVIEVVQQAVATGEKVVISGFLSLEPIAVPARMVRNPRTGAQVARDATTKVQVRVGQGFRDFVTGARGVVEGAVSRATSGRRSPSVGAASDAARTARAAAGEAARSARAAATEAIRPGRELADRLTTPPAKKAPATKAAPAKATATKKATPAKATATKKASTASSTAAVKKRASAGTASAAKKSAPKVADSAPVKKAARKAPAKKAAAPEPAGEQIIATPKKTTD